MNRDVFREVRQRARDRCEYCCLPASFYPLPVHVDHIIARQHASSFGLFHPRRDLWSDPFAWAEARLDGQTAIGRVTIFVLAINAPDFLAVREALIREQVFPLK